MSNATATEIVRRKRKEYRKANKKRKGQILDGITELTGYHRGSLKRLFIQAGKPKEPKKRKAKVSRYAQVLPELRIRWATSF